jgi:uncharacterized protein YjbI with pentapeptide repeats
VDEPRTALTAAATGRERWRADGYHWHSEPPIDEARQAELRQRMAVVADIEAGRYPFRSEQGARIALTRADIEWMLVERGPIFWEAAATRWRHSVDLRGADLSGVDLSRLPMARCILGLSFDDRTAITQLPLPASEKERLREAATCRLDGANLFGTHLEGAELGGAYLGGARLRDTHLDSAFLRDARLVPPETEKRSDSELWYRSLTNLRLCHFDENTTLNDVVLSNGRETIRVADIRWHGVNISVMDWEGVQLGDELLADRFRKPPKRYQPEDGLPLDRIDAYKIAVRANRQVATILRAQGMNEIADQFSYRAHRCQRHLYRLRGPRFWGRYVSSSFLDALAGYGYRPLKAIGVYAVTVSLFATVYFVLAKGDARSIESVREYLVISLAAFHGGGFVSGSFPPATPLAAISVFESFVGLIIEAGFIAAITNRFFSR